jgi:hypothetical protein
VTAKQIPARAVMIASLSLVGMKGVPMSYCQILRINIASKQVRGNRFTTRDLHDQSIRNERKVLITD